MALDAKVIEEFRKAVTGNDIVMMKKFGFVTSDGNIPCDMVERPYVSCKTAIRNPKHKNNVQCPLYNDYCEKISIDLGMKPCEILYKLEN